MSETDINVENPFPARAVTTFGVRTEVAANFEYMRKARGYIIDYLEKYPISSGGLALSGGHGTGKTFLVNWLSNEAKKIKSRESRAVYAKADSDSVPELYRQILKNITRLTLIEVTRKAVLNLGGNRASAAQATQRTSLEIESSRNLEPAFEQKVFDANEVYLLLQKEIERIRVGSTVSQQVAYAIGVLEHPEFGEAAFNWLAGETPQLPKEMPLQSSLWPQDSIGASDIAATALECVAGLFRLAEVPLIVILDQMENFIPAVTITPTQASLLKKLVEQLTGQAALILMAGTPVAWDRLPRDVGPRLLTRTPLLVGGLNTEETALLLKSYYRGNIGFTNEAVTTIRDLSGGGNAREILQIAHRVFQDTAGVVSKANNDLLVKAAQESGTLADRATLALQMIDTAAERLKLSATPTSTNDGQKIDRMIVGSPGACLAIVLLTSPDARAEAEDARTLTSLRKQLASEPYQPGLLVVTVGYSSQAVRALVGEISRVLEFDENKFQELVEGELRRISAPVSRDARKGELDFSPLLEQLARLDERLARIEITRTDAERETAETLQHGAAELAESERVASEAKTRHELRFGLDELHGALTEGDSYRERSILRRLLVANEANVKDAAFDYLGGIYLDALDSVQLSRESTRSDHFESSGDSYALLRSDLIRTMRGKLSSWQRRDRKLVTSVVVGVLLGVLTVGATTMFLVSLQPRWLDSWTQVYLLSFFAGSFVGMLSGMSSYYYLELRGRPERHFESFAWRLSALRGASSRQTARYPEA
jgi:hypothetical protein